MLAHLNDNPEILIIHNFKPFFELYQKYVDNLPYAINYMKKDEKINEKINYETIIDF